MQISSIQQLMRMELRAPSMTSVNAAWRWYMSGISGLLPAAIKKFGWRPRDILIEQGADEDQADRRRTVERSWFGATRLVTDNAAPGLPTSLALAKEKIYRTHLSLPSEAAQILEKTVALRLDELSPIPPEDAAFAIGETVRSADNRINVEIAITKKKALTDLQAQYDGTDIAAIGAIPNHDGALRFIFREENSGERANLTPLISAAMLIAAVFLFSVSIDVHLSRRLQALEQYEAVVLSEIRDMRPALSLFDGIDVDNLVRMRGRSASDLIPAIQNALIDLPVGSRVENINVRDTGIQISGFMPIDQQDGASAPGKLLRIPSNRPGFDRFTVDIAFEVSP